MRRHLTVTAYLTCCCQVLNVYAVSRVAYPARRQVVSDASTLFFFAARKRRGGLQEIGLMPIFLSPVGAGSSALLSLVAFYVLVLVVVELATVSQA